MMAKNFETRRVISEGGSDNTEELRGGGSGILSSLTVDFLCFFLFFLRVVYYFLHVEKDRCFQRGRLFGNLRRNVRFAGHCAGGNLVNFPLV